MFGRIFSIEEFSLFDGPGIRTSVFLKGCPLRCSWCHNPEGQSAEAEIVRSPNGCIGCGRCLELSEQISDRIVFSEKSTKNCPKGLLRKCGEDIDADDLVGRLMKNQRILQNGGGVTFSGGEPFMQSGFLLLCLEKLRGKLHTAVQTSGYAQAAVFDKVLELADFFLFDLKLADEAEHIRYTGVSNKAIISNFEYLVKSEKKFTVKIPLIPTVTDTEENIVGICKIMQGLSVGYAELLPYNKMAGGKYKMLGRKYRPDFDETAEICTRVEIFADFGIKIKVM